MAFTPDQPPGIRYVLLHQDRYIDEFPTLKDAFDDGVKRYGDPPFTVIEKRIEGGGGTDTFVVEPWKPKKLVFKPAVIPLQPERPWHIPRIWQQRGPSV